MNYKVIGYQIDEVRNIRHFRDESGNVVDSEPCGPSTIKHKLILVGPKGETLHAEVPEHIWNLISSDVIKL